MTPPPILALSAIPALPGLWSLTPLGAVVVLLVLNWWMLNGGRLYTKGSHGEIVSLHKQRYEAQMAILEKKDATIDALTEQNRDLIKSNSIIDDFFKKADAVLDGGGEHDEQAED